MRPVVTLFLGVCGLASVARAAGEVAFFPVEASSVSPEDATEIGELLAEEFARASGQQILYPEQVRKFAEAASSLEQAATALAVGEYVAIRVVGLANGLRIIAVLYRADGVAEHRVSLRVASVAEFADEAARVAEALVNRASLSPGGSPPRETTAASPETDAAVMDHEVAPPARASETAADRLFLEKTIGFKVLTHVMFAQGQVLDPAVSGQFSLRLEGPHFFIEFAVGAMLPVPVVDSPGLVRGFAGLVSELGAAYYITQDAVAWSVGGGIQPRLLAATGLDFSVYLAPYAQVGVEFLRDKSVRMFVDLRVSQNVIPAQFYAERDNVSREFFPTETGVQIGLGW